LDFAVDEEGKVSVWRVEEEDHLLLLGVALSANSDLPGGKDFEYVEFLQSDLADFGIPIDRAQGDTDCPEANSHHFDLSLTAENCERLVSRIGSRLPGKRVPRIPRKQLRRIAKTFQWVRADSWLLK